MEWSKKRVYIKTMGCKVNTFDSHSLASQFEKGGFESAQQIEEADVVVLNSCSVTQTAEKEARYLLRRYQRENPKALKVMTGCYAQIDSANLIKLKELDFLVPNEGKIQLVDLVKEKIAAPDLHKEKFPKHLKAVEDNRQKHFKASATLFDQPKSEKTRAFLKVQDGCNGFCAYCQIPWARGASVSVPSDQIMPQVKTLLSKGTCEIVLTGIHIGDYGKDFPKEAPRETLAGLIRKMAKEPGLKRIRISSLEPSELSDELLEALKEHKSLICDHFHLPLQSGSDEILKKMGRQYNGKEYFETVGRLRSVFPEAMISCDVIPGFPGETEEHFLETVEFIKRCELASLHVFPYSARPNTRALKFPNHVEKPEVSRRAKVLRELSEQLYFTFARKCLGKTMEVLWESSQDEHQMTVGKTKNYLPVRASLGDPSSHVGQISSVIIKGFLSSKDLLGLPVES